jgi:hypothetical protein
LVLAVRLILVELILYFQQLLQLVAVEGLVTILAIQPQAVLVAAAVVHLELYTMGLLEHQVKETLAVMVMAAELHQQQVAVVQVQTEQMEYQTAQAV